MAVLERVSVEEYLHTVYRPDCEYLDGVVEERNLGELDHAWIQTKLAAFFMSRFRETGIVGITEFRYQTRPGRFRVPDLIVTRGKPNEQILTTAPLLCIEILSPEDRISRVNTRVQEYLENGVPVVWVVDPADRKLWIYRRNGLEEAIETVKLDGTSIEIPFSEIFD